MQRDGRWLLALALALAACQAAPPPPRPQAKDAGALAVEALQRGDYPKAAELYRSALAAEPGSLPLHYGLGVAASYLDRRAEAIGEFTWVLERGETGAPEVKMARRFLLSVGALPRSAGAAPEESREQEAKPDQPAQKPALASLHGRVLFGEKPGEDAPMGRKLLFFWDHPNRIAYYSLRTDEGGRYRFANVPPGVYQITDRIAGQPRWRLRVDLKPGQDVALDLTPANSTRVRDDFPEPTQLVGSRSH